MLRASEPKYSQDADGLSQPSIEESDSIKVPVVRKLKPPPEIWELVHPVPPKPTHGGAFISQLASSRPMFALLVVLILCVGGYIALRSGKRIAGTRSAPVETATKVDARKVEAEVDKKSPQESQAPAGVLLSSDNQTTAVGESEYPKRKAAHRRSNSIGAVTYFGNRSTAAQSVPSPAGSEVSLPGNQKTRSLANTTEAAGANSADATSHKSKTSLSPQLIDSPKTGAPRKPKVIEWP